MAGFASSARFGRAPSSVICSFGSGHPWKSHLRWHKHITLYNKHRRCGGRWEEKYVTVWAHYPHMPTMSQTVTFFCSLSTGKRVCQTQKRSAIWGSGSRSLYSNRLDCVACTASASSTQLPLSHTNTAIMQSLLSAWCCTVLFNILLLSYLLFSLCLTALCSVLSSSFQTVSILEQRLTLTENKLKECVDNQKEIVLQLKTREET